jgi:transcriptional regulator with XRE-family HTH domain
MSKLRPEPTPAPHVAGAPDRAGAPVSLLWGIVQRHIDAAPYPPSVRQVALRIGISPQALWNWRTPRALPSVENLRALSSVTGTPYAEVLDAALRDAGYLPAEDVCLAD